MRVWAAYFDCCVNYVRVPTACVRRLPGRAQTARTLVNAKDMYLTSQPRTAAGEPVKSAVVGRRPHCPAQPGTLEHRQAATLAPSQRGPWAVRGERSRPARLAPRSTAHHAAAVGTGDCEWSARALSTQVGVDHVLPPGADSVSYAARSPLFAERKRPPKKTKIRPLRGSEKTKKFPAGAATGRNAAVRSLQHF